MRRAQLRQAWARFWMNFAGTSRSGRTAARLASWFYPPYKARYGFAGFAPAAYISPSAINHYPNPTLGKHAFVGDGVTIFTRSVEESVILGDKVFIKL